MSEETSTIDQETGLNPNYTFDKYVIGSSNRIVVSLTQFVVANPGTMGRNPLYIYGGIGLGKDHIIQAAGNYFLQLHPKAKVRYLTIQQFIAEFNDAIYKGHLKEYQDNYREIDLLLLDDFQLIASNETAQNEISGIFNNLIETNKQIIIGADRPPRALLTITEQLRSVLDISVIADVQLPDYEMRVAILKDKARTLTPDVPIPEGVFQFIAHKIVSSVRELEEALTRVIAYAAYNKVELSVEQAVRALNDLMLNSRKKTMTPPQIIEQVSQFFSIEKTVLTGPSRSLDILIPRQLAMYIIRDQTELSLAKIGRELGGRNATTVKNAIAKIEQEIETSPGLRQQINTIVQLLYAENSVSN